jgi:DNA polymerase V
MIALVDCNNFYASCERVFRPELEGKPVIVLSNNDGCAIAISDEAKAFGIKMAVPVHMIEDIITKNNVSVFSSNYTLYGDMSARVMSTLSEFAPRMEVYSIDEAFIDFDGIPFRQLEPLATKIKKTVKQYVGIPVSVGVAPTKTLAKMANRFAKKTKKAIGVHVMQSQEEIDEVLKYTEVGDVWGIGAQHAKRLSLISIKTAFDFIQLPESWVRQNMTVVGLRMHKEMRGIPCIEWEFTRPKRKGICTSRSFGKLITDRKDIEEAIANFAANCALKLRNDKSCTNSVHVFIQTNPFRHQDKQFYRSMKVDTSVATNDTTEIIKYALQAFNFIFMEGYNFMKAGVMVTEIVPDNEIQQGLFDNRNRKRNSRLMNTMDSINNVHGKNCVRSASQGYERKWRLKAAKLSKCYTTDINQLLTINCHV